MVVCEKTKNKIKEWVKMKQELTPNENPMRIICWAAVAFGVPWKDIEIIIKEGN